MADQVALAMAVQRPKLEDPQAVGVRPGKQWPGKMPFVPVAACMLLAAEKQQEVPVIQTRLAGARIVQVDFQPKRQDGEHPARIARVQTQLPPMDERPQEKSPIEATRKRVAAIKRPDAPAALFLPAPSSEHGPDEIPRLVIFLFDLRPQRPQHEGNGLLAQQSLNFAEQREESKVLAFARIRAPEKDRQNKAVGIDVRRPLADAGDVLPVVKNGKDRRPDVLAASPVTKQRIQKAYVSRIGRRLIAKQWAHI